MEKRPNVKLLKEILKNYMSDIEGIIAVAICDRDGFIIASEFRVKEEEESDVIIGAISAMLDNYIDRIESEFGTHGDFFNITTTGDKKFALSSQGPHSILTTVASQSTTDIKLKVYSEHIATKVEQVIDGNENVSPKIPEIIRALSKTRGGELPRREGEFTNKVILTGDYAVGKTSLIRRFVENEFKKNYISTLGVQVSEKTVNISESTLINYVIWDIGGQITQIAPYRKKFYNGANAAFIVIDRTRPNNLESVEKWYSDIRKSVERDIPIVIVGNKSDLVDEIVINEEEIKEVAKEYNFHYILTSALTGENVNDAFLYIAYREIEDL
ncbi:MAG: GTP-binding protein [Promethearchaeota archaeon]|nr:MAG: GTP-binding protein [Candidatus Lokiarchaeota archaeon]